MANTEKTEEKFARSIKEKLSFMLAVSFEAINVNNIQGRKMYERNCL